MIEIAEQAKQNQVKITQLNLAIERMDKERSDAIQAIRRKALDDRYAIEEKERKDIAQVEASAVDKAQPTQELITQLYSAINQVKRTLNFMQYRAPAPVMVEPLTKYDRYPPFIEYLGCLLLDDYLKIEVFISQNGKPVNKYSVVALGNTIFHEDDFRDVKAFRFCGFVGGAKGRYEITYTFKEFASLEQARKYWELADKQKLLAQVVHVDKFYMLKKEFDDARTHRPEEFADFIFLRCECGGFYTTFDRDSYSHSYWDHAACPHCEKPFRVPAVTK